MVGPFERLLLYRFTGCWRRHRWPRDARTWAMSAWQFPVSSILALGTCNAEPAVTQTQPVPVPISSLASFRTERWCRWWQSVRRGSCRGRSAFSGLLSCAPRRPGVFGTSQFARRRRSRGGTTRGGSVYRVTVPGSACSTARRVSRDRLGRRTRRSWSGLPAWCGPPRPTCPVSPAENSGCPQRRRQAVPPRRSPRMWRTDR